MASWKKNVGATPFDPATTGASGSTSLLDELNEPEIACPVITIHGDAPDTKAKLNTMKSVMEIMVAVTRRPGMLASDEQRDIAVADLLRMIREEAETFTSLMGAGSRQRSWITGQATQLISHLMAQQWVHQGNHDVSNPVGILKAMFASTEFAQFANSVGDLDYRVTHGKDDATARLNLSLAKVTSAIYFEARRFSFYQDPQDVLAHLVKRVADAIQAEPSQPDVSADLRISRVQSRLGRLGDLVAAEYAETIDKAMELLIDIAHAKPRDFAAAKTKLADEWQGHADSAFERALKGYQRADALADQVLVRFQAGSRTNLTPTP